MSAWNGSKRTRILRTNSLYVLGIMRLERVMVMQEYRNIHFDTMAQIVGQISSFFTKVKLTLG